MEEETVKYALLIYSAEAPDRWAAMPEAEQKAVMAEYYAISSEPSVYGGEQLQPAGTATTLSVENGTTVTTDGPFADTKEVLGGLYLLEADNLDVALAMAARIPAARMGGHIEVRPLVEM
jgi:hypothetical protein